MSGIFSIDRILRFVHGWLGIIVLPLVLAIGLTGFYLNHPDRVDGWLQSASYDEAKFDNWPNPLPVDEAGARAVAVAMWPGETFQLNATDSYHGRDVFMLDSPSGRVIVTKASGHYWVKTAYSRKTFDPDGRVLDTKTYWNSIFADVHKYGWPGDGLGTLLADIAALAMVLFALTGLILLFRPRGGVSRGPGPKTVRIQATTPRPRRIKLER